MGSAETEPGAGSRRRESQAGAQRGVLAVTVRVIQTISSAEMMISAMPMIVSTKSSSIAGSGSVVRPGPDHAARATENQANGPPRGPSPDVHRRNMPHMHGNWALHA